MSKKVVKTRRDAFKADEEAVRTILNRWDPIAGSPEDEYDCLVHRILSALHEGANRTELKNHIEHELTHHFGIRTELSEVEGVVKQVSEWWQAKTLCRQGALSSRHRF